MPRRSDSCGFLRAIGQGYRASVGEVGRPAGRMHRAHAGRRMPRYFYVSSGAGGGLKQKRALKY
jgi:hypothetical protein